MNAFNIVGYTRDGEFYCAECFDGDPDSEDVGAVFADSEWDEYPTCASCGETCEDICLTSEDGDEADVDEDF